MLDVERGDCYKRDVAVIARNETICARNKEFLEVRYVFSTQRPQSNRGSQRKLCVTPDLCISVLKNILFTLSACNSEKQ
jgi:hypothetical protein